MAWKLLVIRRLQRRARVPSGIWNSGITGSFAFRGDATATESRWKHDAKASARKIQRATRERRARSSRFRWKNPSVCELCARAEYSLPNELWRDDGPRLRGEAKQEGSRSKREETSCFISWYRNPRLSVRTFPRYPHQLLKLGLFSHSTSPWGRVKHDTLTTSPLFLSVPIRRIHIPA